MAVFLDEKEVYQAYIDATTEADQWRKPYNEYERLMDNGLMEGLDESLPEVNDGSLAASLFKLAKRVIKKKLQGRPIALDRTDKWINDLADLQWRNNILPHANSMATPRRKWKDAARKAAGYGGQPIITLFVENGNYTGSDFIVPYCQDVKLEAGKVSDMDSDVIFWDVYYSKLQLKNIIEEAKEEAKNKSNDGYNKWDIPALQEILNSNQEENRAGNEESRSKHDEGVKKSGYHFYVAYQRGVEAPFMMCYPTTKKCVREWTNPDPTGDIPVHYLYFYQDFINPYGVGIVKLAGGTQNVLDYFRQSDILATQIGISPPKLISGDENDIDEESMVMAPNANWYVGNTRVSPWNMSNGVYQDIPNRISMYQTSLQKIIPMGDTTISSSDSGDPQVGKTPQALKMADASLSIDDEDFSESIDECYAMVAKSMINTHFANMQGSDLMQLNSDEQQILQSAGIEFPMDEAGNPSQELEIKWDEARAKFDFEIDPDADKTKDEEQALDGKLRAYEMINADPNIDMYLQQDGKKLNRGELLADIFSQLTDNDKIVTDISPEEQDSMQQEQQMAEQQQMMQQQAQQVQAPQEAQQVPPDQAQASDPQQEQQLVQQIMEQYNVPENVAMAMREAELSGVDDQGIAQLRDMLMQETQQPGQQIPQGVLNAQ